MPRYHINNRGEPGLCFARKNCPFGDLENDHYSSKNEAIIAFESKNQDQMFKKFAKGKNPLDYFSVTDRLTGEKTIIPKVDRLNNLGKNKNLKAFSEIFALSGEAVTRSTKEKISEDLEFLKKFLVGKDLEEFEKQTSSLDYSKIKDKEKLTEILLHFSEDINRDVPFGFTYSNGRRMSAIYRSRKK